MKVLPLVRLGYRRKMCIPTLVFEGSQRLQTTQSTTIIQIPRLQYLDSGADNMVWEEKSPYTAVIENS